MVEKTKCPVCGTKMGGFGRSLYEFESIAICSDCYDKVKQLKTPIRFITIEELKGNQTDVLKEMNEHSFPQDVIDGINDWYNQKENRLIKRIEKNGQKLKAKQIQDKVNNGEYREKISHYLLTTADRFEGYKIIEYKGIVTGEVLIGTGFLGSVNADFADTNKISSTLYDDSMQEAREAAQTKAIIKSIIAGGNALIGIDIDYIQFSKDMIGVVFNGTSVIVEKE